MVRWRFVWLCFSGLLLPGCPAGSGGSMAPVCGGGTDLVDGFCVARRSPVCLAGTVELDGGCVGPAPARCGAGTTPVDGGCAVLRPDHSWIQLASNQVLADGYSPSSIALFARDGGEAISDDVTLNVVPPTAALVYPNRRRLAVGDPLRSPPVLVPCNAYGSADCAGTFELQLVRTAQPDVIIGTSGPLTLVRPPPVGDPSPCQGTESIAVISGTDPGAMPNGGTTQLGSTPWYAVAVGPVPSSISLGYAIFDARTFTFDWHLGLGAQALTPGVYVVDPERAPGGPKFELAYEGHTCSNPRGSFQLLRLVPGYDGAVKEVLVTFDYTCPGQQLTGCFHFVR